MHTKGSIIIYPLTKYYRKPPPPQKKAIPTIAIEVIKGVFFPNTSSKLKTYPCPPPPPSYAYFLQLKIFVSPTDVVHRFLGGGGGTTHPPMLGSFVDVEVDKWSRSFSLLSFSDQVGSAREQSSSNVSLRSNISHSVISLREDTLDCYRNKRYWFFFHRFSECARPVLRSPHGILHRAPRGSLSSQPSHLGRCPSCTSADI